MRWSQQLVKPFTRQFINRKRTFSLSQMNNVELARTSSWRENALLEEREENVFVKPKAQCRAHLNIVMARKRTFRGTRKEPLNPLAETN